MHATWSVHSLAEVCATGALAVQLLQSRFALDGYVELVFHRDSSEEDGDGRVLEMNPTRGRGYHLQ